MLFHVQRTWKENRRTWLQAYTVVAADSAAAIERAKAYAVTTKKGEEWSAQAEERDIIELGIMQVGP